MTPDHAFEQGFVSGNHSSWLANMHHVHVTKHLEDLADPLLRSLFTLKPVPGFKVA